MGSLVERQLRQRRPGRPKLGEPAFNFSLPALDTSRAWRSQKTSSDSDRARASASPSILTSRWSRRDSLDSFFAVSLMRSVLSFSWSRRVFSRAFSLSRRTTSLSSRRSSVRSDLTVSFWSGEGSRTVRRRGRSGPRPGRALSGLRCRQGLAQPGVLLAQRPGRIEGRRDAGFRKEGLQARHFRLQGRHVPCRAAGFLRLFDGLTQPAPAGLEPRLPRTAIAAGGHFRPAQLFRARFGRVRPRPFPLTL